MSWFRHRELWTNLGFAAGFLALFGGLSSLAVVRLGDRGDSARELQRELREQTLEFRSASAHFEEPERVAAWTDRLERSAALVADRRLRMAELARAAEVAGVDLVSLREVRSEPGSQASGAAPAALAEDPMAELEVLRMQHRVGLLGRYDQVARFLDQLEDGSGTIALDELEIRAADDVRSGLLRADLTVTWIALPTGTTSGGDA